MVSPGIVVTEGVEALYRVEAERQGWGSSWPEIEAGALRDVLPNSVGRPGRTEEIADLVAYLASPRARYGTGPTSAATAEARPSSTEEKEPAMQDVRIHCHSTGAQGALVNAYLVETGEGVVAIDGTLTVSDGRALRSQLESLGTPLQAVLVTHAHPDHYAGVVELVRDDEVPIYATAGVDAVIRRDDALKEEILRPMFGDEWPALRTFPNRTVAGGEMVELGGANFSVLDLGPGESPHDSIWFLGDDRRTVFLGDQCYDGKHAYLADGYYAQWLANIEQLERELPEDATLHLGHGGPVTPAHLRWQREYIETFLDAVRAADWSDPDTAKASVAGRMTQLLPTDELRFLMELSIEPVAAKLGIATET